MAASVPQPPAGDDRNLVTVDENYLAPSFEDRLQIFWEKHARTLVAIIVIVAVGLIARWGFDLFAERRELAIRADYAEASSTAQLQAFATANPRAPLAGVALLRIGDEAYAAGNYADARLAYETAFPLLGTNPLGARARLGAAISPLQAGDVAAAKTALEAMANDIAFASAMRAEAAYHLAIIARDAGQFEEATRLTGLVLATGPDSLWAQRAMQLRSSLPAAPSEGANDPSTQLNVTETASPAAETPSVSFPVNK